MSRRGPPRREFRWRRDRIQIPARKELREDVLNFIEDESIGRQNLAAVQSKLAAIEVSYGSTRLLNQQHPG